MMSGFSQENDNTYPNSYPNSCLTGIDIDKDIDIDIDYKKTLCYHNESKEIKE
jgi:hypothetical protein